MATVALGPSSGKVANRTARVLIERDRDVDVALWPLDTGHTVRQPGTWGKNRPTVFSLAGLAPDTPCAIAFEGAGCPITRRARRRQRPPVTS